MFEKIHFNKKKKTDFGKTIMTSTNRNRNRNCNRNRNRNSNRNRNRNRKGSWIILNKGLLTYITVKDLGGGAGP